MVKETLFYGDVIFGDVCQNRILRFLWKTFVSDGAQWIKSIGEVGQKLKTLNAYNSVNTKF